MSGAVEGVVLLPCPNPWCKSAVPPMPFINRDSSVAVICGCDFHGPAMASRDEAITAWNTRTTPPARSYADGVGDAAQIVEHGYRCSTCAAIFIDTPSDTLNGGHPDNGCVFPNWYRLTEEEQAEAIRLLSQGDKA